jgi:hypothetical protein
LAEFRGLSDRERAGFLLVLEWFENFRLRHEMEAGRDAAKAFWRAEVQREDRKREPWQLDQWSDAIQWYLNWLKACEEAGADHRSLPERLRAAVHSAGSRRGLALRTKQCYGAWAARYAVFAGDEREVMRVETASRFLGSVVNDEDCAYSTQKQALNAVAFFFKYVCGVEDPVFQVKLRKTGTRIPVVLAKPETERLFEKLDEPPKQAKKTEGRYGLAAAPSSREGLQRGDPAGRIGGGDREARDESRVETQLRDASAGGWDGSPDHPGSIGARGDHDDGDLSACGDGGAWAGGGESVGLKRMTIVDFGFWILDLSAIEPLPRSLLFHSKIKNRHSSIVTEASGRKRRMKGRLRSAADCLPVRGRLAAPPHR